jgi:predicted O-methyltransferase YrrM
MANFPENTATVRAEGVTYPVVVPHWQTDYIQGLLMSSGEPYEHDMLQAMASVLRADSLVLDVGANIGNHSLYLANVVGCRVKSFEPNSTLTDALEQSAKLGGIQDRLEVNNIGVGREPGRGQFAVLNPTNLGSQLRKR